MSLQSVVTDHTSDHSNASSSFQPKTTINKAYKENDNGQGDRKFNVVICGIQERDKGTPRHECLNYDVDKVTKIVTQ